MQPCLECKAMISIASHVIKDGYCPLSQAFKLAFPGKEYKSDIALRRFLQMPVAAVRFGSPSSGRAAWFLVSFVEGVDYVNFSQFCEALLQSRTQEHSLGISKDQVKALLGLASSDRERELIKYSVFKTSGLSATSARRQFGFERIAERARAVEHCIEEASRIRLAIDKLSRVQDKALLAGMGLLPPMSDDSDNNSDSDGETTFDLLGEQAGAVSQVCQIETTLDVSFGTLEEVLQQGQYNWFVVVEYLEHTPQATLILEDFHTHTMNLQLTVEQRNLLTLSYDAFKASVPDSDQIRTAAALNGEIVTDSESDNPEEYIGVASVTSERAKEIIAKKRKSLSRRVSRIKAKYIAEKKFLSRQMSKQVKSVVDRFPDIGQSIEAFVSDSNIGADAWRRTGVLTFDGNLRIKQKVTYERIRQHLQDKYDCKFSYGTVVQLCVARNKRRRSSSNYKGVAKVTTRRARKGFELKYNPDKHWSAALYRGLNVIQHTDGTDITNINRDDASGFRLDTLFTNSQHANPTVSGKEILTTRTDYVNRYPSLLQTSSYNFSATKSTSELCAGIVKAAKVHPKNPTQHYADLEMLCDIPELQSAFTTTAGLPKRIECVRVDGATDEGPAHEEVKFWWAVRHLEHEKLVTMVSSRSSGSSYLNRVELQNGCLSLGHSNLFIPSTMAGSAFNPSTGAVDMERVKKNLDLATDVYIDRVNNCPCGETVIHLYKGADSTTLQEKREDLLVFLKGSQKMKNQLKREKPVFYAYCKKVWEMKERHEVNPQLPSQYLFFLLCCFQESCPHPLCQRGKEGLLMNWYLDGPPLTFVPLPVPDPDRLWGNVRCEKCTGFCSGHYLPPEKTFDLPQTSMSLPPSTILKNFFTTLAGHEPSQSMLEEIAKQTLLPVGEIVMWLDHLKTVSDNRKRGAAKAAETRKLRKQLKRGGAKPVQDSTAQLPTLTATTREEGEYRCGICDERFGDSEVSEYWVGCDECDSWFHGDCIGITPENEPAQYYCNLCTCTSTT